MRFKKRFFISALCLALGIVVSLGIIMISKGSDTTNEIEHIYYDCSVQTVMSALDIADYYKETIFPESVKKELESLPEVAYSTSIEGGYGEVLVEEECLELFCMESLNTDRYFYRAPFVVQILSDEYLAELKEFAREEGLYLDVEQVMNGEGVILLHDHILSPTQIEQSKDTVGMPLGVYALEDSKTRRDMVFCGYLDSEYEGLPEIRTTWRSGSICYLLASEKGFQNMGLRERIFDLALNAKPQRRVLLDQKVSRIVEEYNQQFVEECEEYGWSPFVLDFVSKIDVLTSMKDYIVSNRLVMGSICAILFLMGLANYVNVTMTSLAVRRREFAVMESIGLTGKQLKRMLILEGIFYSLVITVLTALGGGMILFGIGKFMTERIEYFVVSYPVAEFAVCVLGLFVSCTLIVLFLHWKYGRTSISQRLRLYAD